MDEDTNVIKAWYECQYCDETHYLHIRYNKTLGPKIDIVKESLESAIEAFGFELYGKHHADPIGGLDMDRLFFCAV